MLATTLHVCLRIAILKCVFFRFWRFLKDLEIRDENFFIFRFGYISNLDLNERLPDFFRSRKKFTFGLV